MTPATAVDGLSGWAGDDLSAALSAYATTVDLLPADWPRPDGSGARRFFEDHFLPAPQVTGLLTGYYEPELPGALVPDGRFCHPLYAAPIGLTDEQPWHDREAIETRGLLRGHELVWLDSALEAFLAQVQGSVRVRLTDGTTRRFGFAAKNGHPYTSIGKELIRRGALSETDAAPDRIRDWAARNADDLPVLLRLNRSFVFFRPLDLAPDLGPLGAMGRPVAALRSIAVDPAFIPLGAPVWVTWQGQARLMIAQDIGSAIKGPGRGDIFFGSGGQAGRQAGMMKATSQMTALLPKGIA